MIGEDHGVKGGADAESRGPLSWIISFVFVLKKLKAPEDRGGLCKHMEEVPFCSYYYYCFFLLLHTHRITGPPETRAVLSFSPCSCRLVRKCGRACAEWEKRDGMGRGGVC